MRKLFAFTLSVFTIAIHFPVHAQKDINQSLLWKVWGNGLAKPSYIFGTMHLICPADYLWTDIMKTSLDSSDKVCLEMDLDDPNVMQEVAAGLIDKSGKEMKDYFTPAQYKIVSMYIKDSLGMNMALLQHTKPVVLQTLMSVKSAYCADPVSYEQNIMDAAHNNNKEVLGLEDPKEQLDALESIPTDSVIKQLLASINDKKSGDTEYAKLIDAYKRQDLPALYALITNSKDEIEDMAVFLDDRNKKWIARMEAKMKSSSIFFAVGAGHLWGDNGIINLLRREGFYVQALR